MLQAALGEAHVVIKGCLQPTTRGRKPSSSQEVSCKLMLPVAAGGDDSLELHVTQSPRCPATLSQTPYPERPKIIGACVFRHALVCYTAMDKYFKSFSFNLFEHRLKY
jgi:hypothetical protein